MRINRNNGSTPLPKLTRRTFLASSAAAVTLRIVPTAPRARHIVTLVYDKGLGMMRIVDRLVP